MTAAPDYNASGNVERWTRNNRCPVCDGSQDDMRGKGVRCSGFRSPDGYLHCSREKLAGSIRISPNSDTYGHHPTGSCKCGTSHGDAPIDFMEKRAHKPSKKSKKKANAKQTKTFSLDEVRRIYGKVGPIVDEYPYHDEQGREVLRVFRIQLPDDANGKPQKDFRQASPEGDGWKLSKGTAPLFPFHLLELRQAIGAGDTVYIVEGEKDVLAVEAADGVATCNVGGADKPLKEYVHHFKGASLVRIVADQDANGKGERHARAWMKALRGIVGELELVAPVEGKDAHDSLVKHGHDLADAFKPAEPSTAEDDAPEAVDTSRFVHVGTDAYAFLRAAPEPAWLVPDFLRVGKTTVLGGSTMTGKSWLSLQVGSSLAAGYPAWPGVEGEVSEGVFVFIGYDPHMTVEDVSRRLDKLDQGYHRKEQGMKPGAWAERFVTVGSSEQTGAFPVDRYRLDTEGCERIAEEILRPIERERGPILGIAVDTLSTALPLGVDENDNPAMTAVISRLSGLALDFKAAALTVHHPTKANSSAGSRFQSWDPMAYFRGAGAIPSAAGVLAGMWAPGDNPSHRVLTCWSNSGRRKRTWFEVADEERGAQGMIDYWWPGEAPDGTSGEDEGANLEALAAAFTEDRAARLSWNAFAKGISGGKSTHASGAAKKQAEHLLNWAKARGIAEREPDKPHRVYLTPNGIAELAQFWQANTPETASE